MECHYLLPYAHMLSHAIILFYRHASQNVTVPVALYKLVCVIVNGQMLVYYYVVMCNRTLLYLTMCYYMLLWYQRGIAW